MNFEAATSTSATVRVGDQKAGLRGRLVDETKEPFKAGCARKDTGPATSLCVYTGTDALTGAVSD